MKTNLEQHIKSQLSERSLNPSENSWDKLSQMINEEKPQAKTFHFTKWWALAIAASVVVCISIFVMNPFEKTKEMPIQIADTKKVPSELSAEKNEIISEGIQSENIQINEKSIPNKIKTELVQSDLKSETMLVGRQENSEIIQVPIKQEKAFETNLIQQELKLPEEKEQEEIAINSGPETQSKPEKKKSNYANPDMLLYSVENNQAISETNNDKSRLVIIDFNK